ncbi:MAG: hypothetical protein HYV68_00315 [Candidatus Taylorbacteria bacterium]|nr:hypothetical protein [Candidatus Taylorbacteria bacterium]
MGYFTKIATLLVLVLLAPPVFGQTAKFRVLESDIRLEDSFVVQVLIDTGGKKINAVEGAVQTSSGLTIQDVRYGDSMLTLWPKAPLIDSAGRLSFQGGVPGGYSGSGGLLFTFSVRANQIGGHRIYFGDFKAFLHDGQGTELNPIEKRTVNILVKEGSSNRGPKIVDLQSGDTEAPEFFVPLVAREASVLDNRYFVSFSAVDKHSGIQSYRVVESPFILRLFGLKTVHDNAVTPVALKYQYWPSRVTVSATDKAGYSAEVTVSKSQDKYVLGIFGAALISICAGLFIRARRKKSNA